MLGKALFRIVVASGAALLLNFPAVPAETKGRPDYEAVALKVVTQSAAVKEGEIVVILGYPEDLALLEAIAVNVRKLGAFPLIRITTDRLNRRLYSDVPARYDSQTPAQDMKLAGIEDVLINVNGLGDPELLKGVPAERIDTVNKAAAPVFDAMLKRSVRQIEIGNGLYPTASIAKQYGLSRKELSRIFWDGLNVDYTTMRATGEALRSVLEDGREVHVTHPNGTDIRFRIEGRPVLINDGRMTQDQMRKGGAAVQVWLPAGEVFTTAVPGTAEGKVVVDRALWEGKEITGLTMLFAGGKMTSMTAKSGLERAKAFFDAAGEGRDVFNVLDIGINPNVRVMKGSRLLTFIATGTVSLGVGGNMWADETNTSAFSLNPHIPGCTVTVDGKTIVEDGALRL